MGVVVIRELPETPETLSLRGLGKDKILTQAFANISELPPTRRERNDILEVCIKHFKYLIELTSIVRSSRSRSVRNSLKSLYGSRSSLATIGVKYLF
jgi:hypothetical protein